MEDKAVTGHHQDSAQVFPGRVQTFTIFIWKAELVQWWKHSPPTNVALAWSDLSWEFFVCDSQLKGFLSGLYGLSPFTKRYVSKVQFNPGLEEKLSVEPVWISSVFML